MINATRLYESKFDRYHEPYCWGSEDNAYFAHFHSSLELIYVQNGAMNAFLDGIQFEVRAGEIVVMPSFCVHRFESPKNNNVIILVIPLDYIQSFPARMSDRVFPDTVLPACEGTERIAQSLRVLLEYSRNNAEPYITRGQIYTILGILVSRFTVKGKTVEKDRSIIQDILIYIDENYRNPISLDKIAGMFNYSSSRISHIFNQYVGCNLSEYIGVLRARAAAVMLLENKVSITDIAMNAGFDSIRTFYRYFNRCFGVTPSQYGKLSADELILLMEKNNDYEMIAAIESGG